MHGVVTDDRCGYTGVRDEHNYIHVDPDRAADSPLGTTIAHGFFSLALIASTTQLLHVRDATTGINYGLDRVRFPAPLPVGARYRYFA